MLERDVDIRYRNRVMTPEPHLTATVSPLTATEGLAQDWRELAASVSHSFFQSWFWVSALIAGCAKDETFIARVVDGERLVALGVFNRITERRNKIVTVSQLRLHEAGASAASRIESEYTNILAAPENLPAAWRAIFTALRAPAAPRWDEVVIANATTEAEAMIVRHTSLSYRRTENPSAYVDLKDLRHSDARTLADYLETLGRNTRSQIKRTKRLYAAEGAVSMRRAQSTEEAIEMFDALATLHEEKWRRRGARGLKSEGEYYAFHRRFIAENFHTGAFELLCARAGDAPFGYLYNFLDKRCVYFNAGGFVTRKDNRFKPGLLMQSLAIADHLQSNREIYDFMAGGDRYKFNLGVKGPALVSFSAQRSTPKLHLESAARRLKEKIHETRRGV